MTDKQFAAYNRMLIGRLKSIEELLKTSDKEKVEAELHDFIDDLQKSLED